jgi:hypothetical protein
MGYRTSWAGKHPAASYGLVERLRDAQRRRGEEVTPGRTTDETRHHPDHGFDAEALNLQPIDASG